MHTLWYAIIVVMLTSYVVLDGFDLGAGIIHLMVARNDEERRLVFAAIGPYWNGNEVFLVATGGLLVFAFPRVYAVGFSGFYLPLMMLLWLLILRGISIEFRSKEENNLWRTFWDNLFFLSSLFISIVLGAALGNVIRGVPLGPQAYFDGPLWTNFLPSASPGLLDWYTISVGSFAALILCGHGALYVGWKTPDPLSERCYRAAKMIWPAVAVWGLVVTAMTAWIRPMIYENLSSRPWSYVFAATIAISLVLVLSAIFRQRERLAFLASCALIAALLCATAAGMYPYMLVSTINPSYSITAESGSISDASLIIGLFWFVPTIILAKLYFFTLFRTFRGKTTSDAYMH